MCKSVVLIIIIKNLFVCRMLKSLLDNKTERILELLKIKEDLELRLQSAGESASINAHNIPNTDCKFHSCQCWLC